MRQCASLLYLMITSRANELRWFILRWCFAGKTFRKTLIFQGNQCIVVCPCLSAAITTTDVQIYESYDIFITHGRPEKNCQGKLNCNFGAIYNSGRFKSEPYVKLTVKISTFSRTKYM